MRKRIFGRRFKRSTGERKALFKNLIRSFFLHGKIETTEAKAKAIRGKVEKLVTKAKRRGESARAELQKNFDKVLLDNLLTTIAPKFATRPGGYTRIVRTGRRKKDNAPMVLLEWVEEIAAVVTEEPKKGARKAEKSKETKEVIANVEKSQEKKPIKVAKAKGENAKSNKTNKIK